MYNKANLLHLVHPTVQSAGTSADLEPDSFLPPFRQPNVFMLNLLTLKYRGHTCLQMIRNLDALLKLISRFILFPNMKLKNQAPHAHVQCRLISPCESTKTA